ncbi:MAG: hypothetical protein HC911_18175 [Chloroflexaceae bacterium]|nr:hypothetical protein [Chloroflexaceae bacterium]
MIYIVNVSGGLASFEALRRTIERYGVGNTVAVFADTLIEDPDLYRFLDDTERVLGVPITRLQDGRTPFEVWKQRRLIARIIRGNRVAKCSLELKRGVIDAWVAEHYPDGGYTLVFGYTWDEPHRMEKIAHRLAPVPTWFPLSEPPYLDKCGIAAIAQGLGIASPRLYEMGFSHNNCGGGCVWGGQAHWAHVHRVLPDVYARWERAEQDYREATGKDHSILQKYTLHEYRTLVLEVQGEFDTDEWGGCGCFSSAYEGDPS